MMFLLQKMFSKIKLLNIFFLLVFILIFLIFREFLNKSLAKLIFLQHDISFKSGLIFYYTLRYSQVKVKYREKNCCNSVAEKFNLCQFHKRICIKRVSYVTFVGKGVLYTVI